MDLFHRTFGDEGHSPLIILHGLFGMSDNWVSIGKRIADESFRVIIPDMRNHGRSGHSEVFNYPAMADDLLELMDKLGLETASLLGHSMGGKAAMQFSLDHPGRLDKLIVADIGPASGSHGKPHGRLLESLIRLDMGSLRDRRELAAALREVIPDDRLRAFFKKNIEQKIGGGFRWRINLRAIQENLDEVFAAVETDQPFEKPVLFLRGGNSDYVGEKDVSLIKSLFPNSRIRTIEGGSHWLHAEYPDEFVREVLFHLGQ